MSHVEQAGGIRNEQEAAKGGHDQRKRRQHDHGEEVDQRQAEREPAPGSEFDHPRPERLPGNRGEAAAGEDTLLQYHQRAGHHHQDDRDRGGGAVERRRPVGQLENVGSQHGDVGWRAEHRGDAVDAEHDDEGQQHAGNDCRRDQRKRNGEQGT
jgi:hypothetical protein